jgi:post-segregation antitoxin (ccd killing protein)
VSLVDVDLSDYRRKLEQRSVRRNVTLPSWLNYEAEKAGMNVSAILQDALKEKLAI